MTESEIVAPNNRNAIRFLSEYGSENTIAQHRFVTRDFLGHALGRLYCDVKTKKTLTAVTNEELEQVANSYFVSGRDYEQDVKDYNATLQGRPPITVQTYRSCVKTFLAENNVEFRDLFWKGLRKKVKGGRRARTIDLVPSNADVQKILVDLPLHGKCIFLFLLSSGCRIGETLKLNVADLDFRFDPVRVNISGEITKTRESRTTFISTECKLVMQEWLEKRQEFMEHRGIPATDTRLFPFQVCVVATLLYTGLKRANLLEKDPHTNRYRVHLHVFRKFFRTRLGSVMLSDFVEALMGHEEYLAEVYSRHSIEEIAEKYKEAEHALAIFSDTALETQNLKERLAEKEKEVSEQNKKIDSLDSKLTQLMVALAGKV
jgi:integrase